MYSVSKMKRCVQNIADSGWHQIAFCLFVDIQVPWRLVRVLINRNDSFDPFYRVSMCNNSLSSSFANKKYRFDAEYIIVLKDKAQAATNTIESVFHAEIHAGMLPPLVKPLVAWAILRWANSLLEGRLLILGKLFSHPDGGISNEKLWCFL